MIWKKRRRIAEPAPTGVGESVVEQYDYEEEERLVAEGDYEGWRELVKSRPFDGGLLDSIVHIAHQVSLIQVNKARREGMF